MSSELVESTKNLEILEKDGKTTIVFRKAALKGKVTNQQVLNTILIAAQLQVEKYIEKLSRGAPLEPFEVKALKELADITKLQIDLPVGNQPIAEVSPISESAKAQLYSALAERLKS